MTTDVKLKELVEDAESNIVKLFENSDSMKNYLDILHKNNGLTYYAAAMLKEDVSYVDTYEGWKERGYQVKAGEHGTAIFQKRKQIRKRFIDDYGKVRDVASATYIERQRIKNGDIKLNFDLSSYYNVQYVFDQKQTTAENVNLDIVKPESSLSFEDIKTVIHDSINEMMDDDEVTLPGESLSCARAYATYLFCLNENIPGNHDDLFSQSVKDIVSSKMDLSDMKNVLKSVIKVTSSELTFNLLEERKEEIINEDKEVSSATLTQRNQQKNKIKDFGKKIGGARKDLWKARGLSIDDLTDMNLAEKNKFATKNNIWKKPDYKKMVDEGLPVRVAYFIKTVRDALPAKPVFQYDEKNNEILAEEKIKGYVQFITEFKKILESISSEEEVLSFYNDYIRDVYVESKSLYSVVPTEKCHGCMTNKLLKACQVGKYTLLDFDRKIKKKQFCYSEHDKKVDGFEIAKFDNSNEFEEDRGRTVLVVKKGYSRYYHYLEGELADTSQWNKDTYYVLYNGKILCNNLTLEQAKEAVEKISDKFEEVKTEKNERKKRKSKFVPKQLENIERDGPNNGLNELNHATGDMYLDKFAFAGGEFGNWMSEKDRQASLDFGYDALIDLADALDMDYKDISLNGELSIAFGARGHSSALAHYEPERQVINLTKMRGAGSLAHEWGHAFDNIISKKLAASSIDTWLTDKNNNNMLNSVKELMHAIKYRPATSEERHAEWEKTCKIYEDNFYCSLKDNLDSKSQELIDEFKIKTSKLMRDENCNEEKVEKLISNLSDNYEKISGQPLHLSYKKLLVEEFMEVNKKYTMPVREIKCPEEKTDFYKNSIKFDSLFSKEARGYWQSDKELFARAFACYVKDKLPYRSDYLCGHAEAASIPLEDKNGKMTRIQAYPVGEERETINKCFDNVIDEIKKLGLIQARQKEPVQLKRKSR